MSKKDNSGPAFPVSATNGNLEAIDGFFDGEQIEPGNTATYRGLSVRDYFAAMAMQAVATNPTGAESFTFDERAKWAYQQADAMLKTRAE